MNYSDFTMSGCNENAVENRKNCDVRALCVGCARTAYDTVVHAVFGGFARRRAAVFGVGVDCNRGVVLRGGRHSVCEVAALREIDAVSRFARPRCFGPVCVRPQPHAAGRFHDNRGEAFLFGSVWVGAWGVLFLIAEHFYLKRVEEPSLAARFGHGYLEYYRNVPRWFPRSTPWKPSILP